MRLPPPKMALDEQQLAILDLDRENDHVDEKKKNPNSAEERAVCQRLTLKPRCARHDHMHGLRPNRNCVASSITQLHPSESLDWLGRFQIAGRGKAACSMACSQHMRSTGRSWVWSKSGCWIMIGDWSASLCPLRNQRTCQPTKTYVSRCAVSQDRRLR